MLLFDKLLQPAHEHFKDKDEECEPLMAEKAELKTQVVTTGLVVHSVADGVSLAASLFFSEVSESKSIGLVIYFAILIHKIPASIGLGSFLRGKGVDEKTALRSIL